MKKNYLFLKICLAVMLITGVFGSKVKATVWPIPNTVADTLERFIEDTSLWEPSDTIMVSDDSKYIINGTIDFFQEITLIGNPELDNKPYLKFEDNGFRAKEDSISIVIAGLSLDGYKSADTSRRPYMLRFDQAAFYNYENVIIEDCEVWGFQGGIQLYKNQWTKYDTVSINNCIFFDLSGQYVLDPRQNASKLISITNSTFYDIETGFLKNPYFSDAGDGRPDVIEQKIIIDHNTFFNVAGGGNNALIQINDPNDESIDFTFSNNIVSKLFWEEWARPFRINELAGEFNFTYNCFHDYYSTYEDGVHNLDSIVKNQSNVDTFAIYKDSPLFNDTANADFTLSYASPYLKAASDGGALGDPRWIPEEQSWVPGPHIHQIPNSSADTLERFIENYYNTTWFDGDTILLVNSSEYLVNGTIDFYGETTIMGDPRLSTKPTLKFNDNGFRAKEDSISIVISGLKLNGYRTDDSRSPYILRFDQTDFYNYENVIIEDCEVWGFTGGIQLFKNQWTKYDTVAINNCIFFDLSGQYVLDPRQNASKLISITNSTFYDIETGFLKNPYFSDAGDGRPDVIEQKIIIDHNTFFNVAGGGNNALIQINDPNDESIDFTFSNNIVTKLFWEEWARPFRINELAGEFLFTNSTFHDYYSTYQDGVHNLDSVAKNQENVTSVSIYDFYPAFSDTANRYFMLPDTSSLLMAATDGGAIGDPRWIPIAGVTIRQIGGEVAEGMDIQLLADVVLSEGADTTLTWTVTDQTGSATIDENTGLLSPVTAGTITVKATSNYNTALYDEMEITIVPKIYVTGIALEGTNAQDNTSSEITSKAGFLNITATITPATAHDKTLDWSISSASDGEASLSVLNASSASIIASECGTVYVVAMAMDGSGVKDSLEVAIRNQQQAESVTVEGANGDTTITTPNGTLQMIATVLPENTCIKEVEWSVDDVSIATIDATTGLLTAVANGTVTVTAIATDDSYRTGTIVITITNQSTGIDGTLADELQVVPNPASNFIYIKSNEIADVEIRNIVGSVIMKMTIDPNAPIDINELKSGIYFVHVNAGNSSSLIKLIKK